MWQNHVDTQKGLKDLNVFIYQEARNSNLNASGFYGHHGFQNKY